MIEPGGGPAFPVNTTNADNEGACFAHEGMLLRDYFAAKAMQARLSDYEGLQCLTEYAQRTGQQLSKVVADQAYDMADAMLKTREA